MITATAWGGYGLSKGIKNMCNCRQELEEKLTERLIKEAPNSTNHRVILMGYAMVLTDKGCVQKAYMPYETSELAPLKKGGSKPKKTTGNMFFSYCPFCGEKA